MGCKIRKKKPKLLKRTESKDYLKGIPKEWCMILKQQCSLCPICKNSTRNEWHMETKHQIEVVPYKEIWKAIKDNYEYETKRQKKKSPIMHVKREVFLEWWNPKLKYIQETTEVRFQSLFNRI
jgi:hypothetical protein